MVGALDNLGHQIGRNTVKRVLRRHDLEPAPARGKRTPWKTFLRTHVGAIAAADFFLVEVLTLTGLVCYLVLFVIDLQTIGGVVRQAHIAWMKQVARNLTDGVDGCAQAWSTQPRIPCCSGPCGGRRSVVAVVVDSAVARTVLAALGLPCTRATFAPVRDPPQGELWFDDAS